MAAIRVLVADDSAIMRKAIRSFLKDHSDILLVGEAEDFDEAVVKAKQLQPDVVVFDLHLSERCKNVQWNSVFGDAKLLVITLGVDDESKGPAEHIGTEKVIDKMNLTKELIPAILELAPAASLG
jgi:DNA-binding NarL/FixJ family response regulator